MDRGTRMTSAYRARFLLTGVIVLAVLVGGSYCVTRGVFDDGGAAAGQASASARGSAAGCGAAGAAPCTGNLAGVAAAASPAVVTVPSRQASRRAHQTGTGSSAAPSARPAEAATGTASAQPSAPTATASASSSPAQGGEPAAQVLALINQARSAAGLPALTIASGLSASSAAHNLRMADGCGLSHQCPGEPPLGDRETAAGVHWTAAGENIGEGGPVAGTTAAIAQTAVGLTQSMLNEQPPNDGHRLNILSSTFTHIGIAVYRDSSGTVWLTQDFSN
jgi:uncharacterized protein YkwD